MSKSLSEEPIPQDYREFLSVNLRRLVLDKFETAAEFHRALGSAGLQIERTNVYNWFLARRFPDIEHLHTIAAVLDVEVSRLIPACPKHLRSTIGRRTK